MRAFEALQARRRGAVCKPPRGTPAARGARMELTRPLLARPSWVPAPRSLCPQPLYGTLAVPLLAMHGTANGIASLDAVRRFVSAAASHDKQLLTWHCAYHELFFEPEADAVVDALLAWLLRRVAAASANDVADAGGALCS